MEILGLEASKDYSFDKRHFLQNQFEGYLHVHCGEVILFYF